MAVDKRFIIRKMMNLETIYVAKSKVTHEPFVEYSEENLGDQVYFFDTMADAQQFIKIYEARHYPMVVAELKRPQHKVFFTELFLIGVDTIVYHSGNEDYVLKLEEVAKMEAPADDGKMPPKKNDVLQLTMIYYLQELRRPGVPQDDPERVQKLAELKEEMWVNIGRSRFIIPMIPAEGAPAENGLKNAKVYLVKTPPTEKAPQGVTVMPIFSDLWECQKFFGNKKEQIPLAVVPFKSLKSALVHEAEGFILNPTTKGYLIDKRLLPDSEPVK
ncbi:MAG: SseB family protein [Lachnospiraceae bacterium]|nr:SseB family protein [Lachnospiraceae bacterium]